MIRDLKPISMVESVPYLKTTEDKEKEVVGFIRKFTKMNAEKAKDIKKKILELDMIKIKSEHIVKIIDIMPETKEDLNKIFTDVNLDENESNKLLETIKG